MEHEKPPPYSPTDTASVVHQPPPGYTPYLQQGTIPPPPVPGYHSYPSQPIAPGYQPTYGTTSVTIQPPEIIIVGACPACRVGVLEDDYTCLGIFCAIFFFPLGILACLALKNRRCSNCGAYFG